MLTFGGIEAGGTKFVCGVGAGNVILRRVEFPTTTPDETVRSAIEFFRGAMREYRLAGIGVASFGPIDLNRRSSTYGYITATPKPGWRDFNVVGELERALALPTAFDTDVNGALAGEVQWGAAKGLTDAVYMTVGTGIGGGALSNGALVHGLIHPEMGHIRVPHDRVSDPYEGCCPFHGDCLEGLACGLALERRWGQPPSRIPPGHNAWPLEAEYLAYAVVNLTCLLSPQRIILGGGVMHQPELLPLIRRRVGTLLNGYFPHPVILEHVDSYIVAPLLGDNAGLIGALTLAAAQLNVPTASLGMD